MSSENKIRDAADAVRGIAETFPVYQDAVQPAAREIGRALQTVTMTIHIAPLPLRLAVWGYDQIEEWLLPTLAQKLRDVPEGRIVTPSPTVAGPTLEALRFAGGEPNLRNLYANLLATSMDAKTAHEAHPAFVEIIRQLTPDEALLLSELSEKREFLPFPVPLISGRVVAHLGNQTSYWHDVRHFSSLSDIAKCKYPELTSSYVDNLCRLGLVEITAYDTRKRAVQPAPDAYEVLENDRRVISDWLPDGNEHTKTTARFNREVLQLTSLGMQFSFVCAFGGVPDRSTDGGTTISLTLRK